MFFQNLLILALGAQLSGGVLHGVVVSKIFQPPLSDALGVDGIYRLELRDGNDRIQSQLVPKEVFFACEIGDEFEARSKPAAPRIARSSLPQDMLPETEGF